MNDNSLPQLQKFISTINNDYRKKIEKIPLFKKENIRTWNKNDIKKFAAVFYHIRAYFIDFMWYLAGFSDNKEIKEIIIKNISEELGSGQSFSHEKLYEIFAKECDVDIHAETIHKKNYLDFARQFNNEHIYWLTQHDIHEQFAAFAAYEKLDNIDYKYLLELALSFDLPEKALTFFKVHIQVNHFETTWDTLAQSWELNPEKVKTGFNFIYSHQYQMWQKLSDIFYQQHPTKS